MRLRIMRKYASNRIMQIMQIMHMIRMAKGEKAKGSRKWLKMDDFFLTIHADDALSVCPCAWKKIRMANTSKNTNMKYDERALLLPDNNFAPGNSEFRQLM